MKQAIALAGGGTKGAYQVGAWKAMRELGIPFDIVTGTFFIIHLKFLPRKP